MKLFCTSERIVFIILVLSFFLILIDHYHFFVNLNCFFPFFELHLLSVLMNWFDVNFFVVSVEFFCTWNLNFFFFVFFFCSFRSSFFEETTKTRYYSTQLKKFPFIKLSVCLYYVTSRSSLLTFFCFHNVLTATKSSSYSFFFHFSSHDSRFGGISSKIRIQYTFWHLLVLLFNWLRICFPFLQVWRSREQWNFEFQFFIFSCTVKPVFPFHLLRSPVHFTIAFKFKFSI